MALTAFKTKRVRMWLCNLRMWTGRQDTVVNINLALTHRQSLAVWHHVKRSSPQRYLGKPRENTNSVSPVSEGRGKKELTIYSYPSPVLDIYPLWELEQQSCLCLLIMGYKDKNVLLCQKSMLLVDKFVVIPPLHRSFLFNVTEAHYPIWKAIEYLWNSF